MARRSEANADERSIAREFAALWLPHNAVEEEIILPALRDAGVDEDTIAAAAIRRDLVNILLADLLEMRRPQFARAKLDALATQFDALVEGAERDGEGVFAALASAETSTPSLKTEAKARYERLKKRFANVDESIGEAMVMLAPRRLSASLTSQQSRREQSMSNRYSNMRERDEQGRFLPDDEREYSRRSRGGPERDDYGRFMSEGGRSRGRYEDEDDRYSRRSMSRDRDDEGRFTRRGGYSEGRGHGGWFGDPEGHSEASRRGWRSGQH
ncbi:MAG: hypothetical protein JO312_16590, partial [Hyphomicrobiales bacterium]|nr:hypothetical protein [Hyphomicrobiales bacterium]